MLCRCKRKSSRSGTENGQEHDRKLRKEKSKGGKKKEGKEDQKRLSSKKKE